MSTAPTSPRPPRWSPRNGPGRLRWTLLGVAIVVLAGLAWIAVTALLARSELNQARGELGSMRANVLSGDVAAATANARSVERHARRAHDLTSGPAWAVSAAVPYLGDPFQTVRGATRAVHVVAGEVLDPLITIAPDLDPQKVIQPGGHIQLAPIVRAAPALSAASDTSGQALKAVQELPAHTWLGPADHARRQLLAQLDELHSTLSTGARAARVAPTLLGATRPQRYFVGLLNTAEARGVGGLPGAFIILVADKGTLTSTHFESDATFIGVRSNVDLGAEYTARYGSADPTGIYVNSTIGPNFPDAAQIWASMWFKYSGEKIDGAVSVDPTALSYLLKVTGPAQLASGEQVSGENFVALTEQQAYVRFPDLGQRKKFLLDVARAVDERVLSLSGDPAGFVKAAANAVDQRRLLLWSADAGVRAALGDSPIAGELPDATAPFALMSVTNVAGSKLDYYLDRSLSWSSQCGNPRTVTVTMTLTNDVPAAPLPAYVTIRADRPGYPTKPGDNRLIVNYFATTGATLSAVTLDGQATTVRTGIEHGHPVFFIDLELPRNATRKIVLTLREPGRGAPMVIEQPLVRPIRTDVTAPKC